MSSRLDKNLITVVTGQAVDAFDKLFRILYMTSSLVDLRKVPMEPEPEPEPLPQPAPVSLPSAAIARKLYNPKYALVTLGNSSPTTSSGNNSPKETSKNADVPENKKRGQGRACKEAVQEAPPLHPGLINLEKACLMSYLPIWPEPDPSSDVIGFINVRDSNKPNQVHLQRSEMFGTSQAIRFSSPFSMPKETLPEVATPREPSAKYKEMNKLGLDKDKAKTEESVVDRAQPTQLNARPDDIKSKAEAPQQKSPAPGPKCDTTKTLNTENKLKSNTPTNQDAGHNTTPRLNAHALPQPSSKAPTPNLGRPSHAAQTVTTNTPKPDSLPGPNNKKEAETILNTQRAVVYRTQAAESNSTQSSHLRSPTQSNTQTKTVPPHTDSHPQAVCTQPQNSSEMIPNIQTPAANSRASSSSQSENNPVSITTSMNTNAPLSSISSSSPLYPLTSSTTVSAPLPSSSASYLSSTSTPPTPKPRTIQLFIKDGSDIAGYSRKLLSELRAGRGPEASAWPPVVHNEPAVAPVVQTSPTKEPVTVRELQNKSGSKAGAQKDAENTGNIGEAARQKQSGTSREAKNEETAGLHDDRAGMQSVAGINLEAQSDALITDAPKAVSVNIPKIIPKDVEAKTLTSVDCKLAPQIQRIAAVQTETKAPERGLTGCESTQVPNEKGTNVTQHKTYLARPHEVQRISYCEVTPQDIGVLETVDSLKFPTHIPVSASHGPHLSKEGAGNGAAGNPSVMLPARRTDSSPNTAKHNTHSTFQELPPKARESTHTPEKSLRLHLTEMHVPDLRSPTPEKEARSLAALARTPTPDGLLPLTPTSGSRTHTPDFRTPTSDVSDGYVSPPSTTSEEYYECSESPIHEPVADQAAYRNHVATEDPFSFTRTNTPTSVTSSVNSNSRALASAALGATDRNTSSSETQSLSGPSRASSSSSLLEKKTKMGQEEEAANEENGREVDEKGRRLSLAERRTEGESRGTERRGSEEAKRTADRFKQSKVLTEAIGKLKEPQAQTPKRKKALNQSSAERLVDRGATPGELTNQGAEPKRWSTGDLRPRKVSSEGERPDKGKAVSRATREPEGQKV